jgi:heterodisulfide reductase subunit A
MIRGHNMEPKNILVIGGGIAGIQASLDLADKGMQVYVVEKEPSIGGRMAQLDKTFPTNDCSICILAPKMADCHGHDNIKVMTYSEVKGIKGEAGNYEVTVERKARHVNEEKCTGCGDCMAKCPVKVPNEFDMGLGMRKAIYLPFLQAVPRIMTIDEENCIYFKKGKCKLCEKTCKIEAIEFDRGAEEMKLNVGAVIVATGYDVWDPSNAKEYGYGKIQNVFTAMEFERMINAAGPTGGHIQRRSDGERPKKIGFIQCVGSRNPQLDHPYCCSVCCMHSTKEAILAREHHDDMESFIFYKDMRTFGKGFNEYMERGKSEYGITYINSDATVDENPDNHNPIVVYDVAGKQEKKEVDMVILATTLVPRAGAKELADLLGIGIDEFGFYESVDKLLNPVDTKRPGIYLAGYCHEPMDIPEAVAQASGAAARAAELLSTKGVS